MLEKRVLDVKGLTAGYGDIEVLKGINLYVEEGETVAIFGSNGSGKSTFLRVIAGLLRPWGGTIDLFGERINDLPPSDRVRRGLALAGEGRNLFLGMSVEENLVLGGWTKRPRVKENLERVYSYFPELKEKRKTLAGDLSGGQQQMLSIGRALMSQPKLLMIDELSLGLAPAIVDRLAQILLDIKEKEGLSILLVEQEVSLALEISRRAYVFDLGEVVDEGASKELMERDSIKRTYLSIV
ncbi:amino acid/amide ABC transporter ATP-binding protein 2 (HAAT family) [Hydrogenivirga caldilitoris]|uniref:Amino acid/amide ABC transporter ATP-binding protein 2 (HAAT family) n=1 Tax=Hydrogenivirga caldilitoris TaxID=246264 RepID=A0A497XSU4_9AQUI|nr:ABC transporter ATP-binding protein [Hydrogenivirga caldilitoris]RLJ71240.1 amino acid/amide ABC transporter ATP-binding protein 2 (HAAT family) [Hydrogenivirga caldilitoris]